MKKAETLIRSLSSELLPNNHPIPGTKQWIFKQYTTDDLTEALELLKGREEEQSAPSVRNWITNELQKRGGSDADD